MLKISLSVKKLICFMLSVVFALSLCACDNTNTASDIKNNVTFTDALGRMVSVPCGQTEAAALIGSFADVWCLAGGKVVATAEDAWEDFGLELDGAVNIGGAHSPSTELLLSADPDFVIASASTASNVDMKETLENAGITVAYFDVDNFDDYLNMIDICTDITGRKDLYKINGLDLKEQIAKIKSDFSAANLTESERTVLILRASSGAVKAKSSDGTILGEMLCDLGCINIADSDDTLLENLSIESIIKNEPYRIFVVTMGDTEKAKNNLTKTMEENPAWAMLLAVQNGRLYFMDSGLFNRKPNARWADAYEELCNILQEK